MTCYSHVRVCGLLLGLYIGSVHVAFGEPTPEQVAIIANKNSSASLAVARHYAARRGVPPGHILELDLSQHETISRTEYERDLVSPVRKLLEARHLASTIRVAVTTYGVPLRVHAPLPTDREQRWRKDASERQRFARAYLEKLPEFALKIAPTETGRSETDVSSSDGKATSAAADADQMMLERVNAAVRDAATRLERLKDRAPQDEITTWAKELTRLVLQAGGRAAFFLPGSPSGGPYGTQMDLARLKQQITLAENMIQGLTDLPSDANRKKAYQLAERMFGFQGILRLATAEIQSFSYQAGDACLDSELSLLWWDPDMYRIAGRIPNPFYYGRVLSVENPRPSIPLLMVSRLDAPTPELAMRLVDRAVETEQRGLSGKVYVDAQGLNAGGPPLEYGYYDQSLRDLASLFRRQTSYEVILDNAERRFSLPGEAPDVAVYVGWYKLRSYEDAFTFVPGAIGYHIASAEAISIHNPAELGWCKNALERGITVTLGSTDEPYLDSFPVPDEFFALFLTGRYSLVEVYTMTSRYMSWRMILFGDPLYNPWRGTHYIRELRGILRSGSIEQSDLPLSPSDLTPKDPLKAREGARQAREDLSAGITRFLKQLDQGGQRSH